MGKSAKQTGVQIVLDEIVSGFGNIAHDENKFFERILSSIVEHYECICNVMKKLEGTKCFNEKFL